MSDRHSFVVAYEVLAVVITHESRRIFAAVYLDERIFRVEITWPVVRDDAVIQQHRLWHEEAMRIGRALYANI